MRFRKVTAIIRIECLEAVEERLKELAIPGISVTMVKGYGENPNYFTRDWLGQNARVEIFIGVSQVDDVVTAIMEAGHTGMTGDGIVAVLPVESVYHIRTQKKCQDEVCM